MAERTGDQEDEVSLFAGSLAADRKWMNGSELLVPIIVLRCGEEWTFSRTRSKVSLSELQSVTSLSLSGYGEAASWPIMGSWVGDKTSINTLGLFNDRALWSAVRKTDEDSCR